jgi:DNA-directed RNA polymerase subunit RPC12/RpoP
MIKKYSYCCIKCWHTWESFDKVFKCPKCGRTEIDVEYDLMFEE